MGIYTNMAFTPIKCKAVVGDVDYFPQIMEIDNRLEELYFASEERVLCGLASNFEDISTLQHYSVIKGKGDVSWGHSLRKDPWGVFATILSCVSSAQYESSGINPYNVLAHRFAFAVLHGKPIQFCPILGLGNSIDEDEAKSLFGEADIRSLLHMFIPRQFVLSTNNGVESPEEYFRDTNYLTYFVRNVMTYEDIYLFRSMIEKYPKWSPEKIEKYLKKLSRYIKRSICVRHC